MEMTYTKYLENEYKNLNNKYEKSLEENKKLKQQIEGLNDENFRLNMIEDEADDKIDELKQELFNAYLKQQHDTKLIAELKEALSSYNNFVDVMFPE